MVKYHPCPKQSLNSMANYRGAKLCKAKGWQTRKKTANANMSQTAFRHNLALSGTVWLFCQYLLPWQCRVFHSSKTLRYLWKELKDQTLSKTSGKDCKDIFYWPFFMKSFCSSWSHSTWGKSFSVLFITDLNHTTSIVERSLTTAISHLSSAPVMFACWQNMSKLISQRVYQILVYGNQPFVKFTHRRSFASSRCRFLIFSQAVFCATPQLTECLE